LAAERGGANNAVRRSYLWGPDAGGGLAGELDGAGGVGGLVGVKEGGTLRWAALDGQGNVAGLVGAGDGVAVGWYEYGPHGELLRATGSAGETNPVRYECKLEDRETGLIYYGFRYYHPGLGRWLGKDPMGEAGGLNLYGYVGGDPINGIDPFGLWDFRAALDGFTAWGSRKRDACKDWVNSGAGGLASQLGATAVNTVFDLTLGTLIDTPGAIAHFGEGAGTFSGDPSLKNLPGLLSDVLIAAGAASGTGALASKAGQAVGKSAVCEVGEKAVEQACSTQAKAAAAGVGEAAKTAPPSLWSKAEFNGTRVYQRNDLINPALVDARGRSNLQRMQQGLAPIGPDGKSINLHHTIQTGDSPLAEMTATFHQQNSRVIHINPNTIPSGIERPGFDAFRRDYWINRANDFTP